MYQINIIALTSQTPQKEPNPASKGSTFETLALPRCNLLQAKTL